MILALAEKIEIAKHHLSLSTELTLYGIGLLIVFFAIRPELWKRLWFTRVDPRPAALTRIAFGLVVFVTFFDLLLPMQPLEYSVARYLFTNDGLWLTEMARKNYGGDLRELYDPEHGFEHWWDPLTLLWGKFTVLHINSDPEFAMPLYWVMLGATLSMVVGFKTRTSTIIAFILVETFYRYSPVFYTGGDTVVRVFLFLGMFSRWGEAYSVDSWLKRKKALLRKGATSVPALKSIPAWPMRLMMLQLCIIYCATGLLKTGGTWKDGSALYYALNLDHFYRVPATGLVTVAHWSLVLPNTAIFVRWWEVLFPLAGIGVALNAYERERLDGTWPAAAMWRKVISVAVFLSAWSMMAWVAGIGGVYYLPIEIQSHVHPAYRQGVYSGVVMGVPLVLLAVYFLLRRFLPRVLRFLLGWVLGRRFWLVVGFGMHIGIDVSMNVGTFAEVMMAIYLVWLRGPEIDAFWRFVYGRRCAPGEGERPARTPKIRRLLAPYDSFRYRTSQPPVIVRHNSDEPSVRRAALLRCLDLGSRLVFEQDESVKSEQLCIEREGEKSVGNAAAASLTRDLPVLLWLRPLRAIPGVGALARTLLAQRS